MKEQSNLLSFRDVPSLPDRESIINRQRYEESLYFVPNHESRDFEAIIAPYHLKGSKIKCGIANCGTPHLHGYLITTSDGLETNIGKDCGLSHFNAIFSDELKRHDELYERRLKIENIIKLKEVAPKILDSILSIKSEYDIFKSLRFRLRGALSSVESQRLGSKVKSGDPYLYRYEILSGLEREAYLETNPSARKTGDVPPKQIKDGIVRGFDFLAATYADEDLFNSITPLKNVISASEEDIYSWRRGEISKNHAWIGKTEPGIARITFLVDSAKTLFTISNIKSLARLGISDASLDKTIREINLDLSSVGRQLS